MNRPLGMLTTAIVIAVSTHAVAESAASSTCGPLDEATKLVLEGYRGEPSRNSPRRRSTSPAPCSSNPATGRTLERLPRRESSSPRRELGEANIFVEAATRL